MKYVRPPKAVTTGEVQEIVLTNLQKLCNRHSLCMGRYHQQVRRACNVQLQERDGSIVLERKDFNTDEVEYI